MSTCWECMYLDHKDSTGTFIIKYRCGHINRYVSANNEACAHYMKRTYSSGCYLTTACVTHRGLDDNCYELTMLRRFRDDYICNLPNGRQLVEEYYKHAPEIVDKINLSDNKNDIYDVIYSKIIECIEYINNNQNTNALGVYTAMTKELYNKYCKKTN